MLTDKRLYTFKDLAVRFLRGEAINNPTAQCLDLEAVDASLGPDRSLLVVMPDSVYHVKIDSILEGGKRCSRRPRTMNRGDPSKKRRGNNRKNLSLPRLLDLAGVPEFTHIPTRRSRHRRRHLDPAAIVSERRIAVPRPLEMDTVHRLLKELGGIDKDGARRWKEARSNSVMGVSSAPFQSRAIHPDSARGVIWSRRLYHQVRPIRIPDGRPSGCSSRTTSRTGSISSIMSRSGLCRLGFAG